MFQDKAEISPLHSLSLCAHLVYLFNNDLLSDVSVLCEDEVFDLHSPVLSHASEYFREMLTNGEKDIVVDITLGIEATVFSILVESMYTGNLRGLEERNVLNVLRASHSFKMEVAKSHCIQFMINNMNANNCLEFWIAGETIENDILMREAIVRIGRHLLEICTTEGFLKLNLASVEKILRDDFLFISSESDVFEAILAWINYDAPSRGRSFCVLLESVRMMYISDSYLINVVGKENLVVQDSKALMMYSLALQTKLEHKPSIIRKRHGVVNALLGRIDNMLVNLSPIQANNCKPHQITKTFDRGLFTICCRIDEEHQSHKSSFDVVNSKVMQPIENALESVQKRINPIFKNTTESIISLANVTGGIVASVKLCAQQYLQHDYIDQSKRDMKSFGSADSIEDNINKTTPHPVKEISSIFYDLSKIDDGGVISSFSFDLPLEHISEASDEDRDSMHSELVSETLVERTDKKDIQFTTEQIEDERLLSELVRLSEELEEDEILTMDEALNSNSAIAKLDQIVTTNDGFIDNEYGEIDKLSNGYCHSNIAPETETYENDLVAYSDEVEHIKKDETEKKIDVEFYTDEDADIDDDSDKVEFTEGSSRCSDRIEFDDDYDSRCNYECDYTIDDHTSNDIRNTSFNDSDKLSFHDDSSRCSEILTFDDDTDDIVDFVAEESKNRYFETFGKMKYVV